MKKSIRPMPDETSTIPARRALLRLRSGSLGGALLFAGFAENLFNVIDRHSAGEHGHTLIGANSLVVGIGPDSRDDCDDRDDKRSERDDEVGCERLP